MSKQRKNKTRAQRQKLGSDLGFELEHAQQMQIMGYDEQVDTYQLPCGNHTILNALHAKAVTQSQAWQFIVIHEYGDWDTGKSRPLSYADIVRKSGLGMSTVIANNTALEAKGWMKRNVRKGTGKHSHTTPNTYHLTNYHCEPQQIPIDKDGRPKACAIPRSHGSVFELVEHGRLSWKAALYWIMAKVMQTNWKDTAFQFTIAAAKQLLHMTTKTLAAIKKELKRLGLIEQTSKRCRPFEGILKPKPYAKKRNRKSKNANKKGWRPMRFDEKTGWTYSYNERWRVNTNTGEINCKEEGRWRHANKHELELANPKILNAFLPLLELAGFRSSEAYLKWATS